MGIEVIGAGFGRTGTLSLKFALEALGFDRCYHMMEVPLNPKHSVLWSDAAAGRQVDWPALYQGYKATVDWPSASFWRELSVAYPNAKVILTRRDPNDWYNSVMATIWQLSSQAWDQLSQQAKSQEAISDALAEPHQRTRMAFDVIWDGVFDRRMDDKDYVISCYEAHNQAVIDEVPADNLLIYEAGQGWQPLCDFLDKPMPEIDYPKVNSSADFNRRFGAKRKP